LLKGGTSQLPPPPPPSMPRKSLHRPLPPPVGRNTRQDNSGTNNTLNNNRTGGGGGSGSISSNTTTTKGLWPSYFNPIGNAGWRPSLRFSTVGQAALHAMTRASTHPLWPAAGSSAFSSGGTIPMDGLVGSTIAGQLLQHHGYCLSCGHRLGG
jgi:hypothetical protein